MLPSHLSLRIEESQRGDFFERNRNKSRVFWVAKFLRKMETREIGTRPRIDTVTITSPPNPPPHTLKMSPDNACQDCVICCPPPRGWKRRKEERKRGGGGYLDAGEAERLVRFEFCIKHQCVDSTYTSPPPMSASPQFHLYWIYNRGRHAIECNCAGSSA